MSSTAPLHFSILLKQQNIALEAVVVCAHLSTRDGTSITGLRGACSHPFPYGHWGPNPFQTQPSLVPISPLWLLDSFPFIYWLLVSTPLNNMSQLGWLFPRYGKIKFMFQTTNQHTYSRPHFFTNLITLQLGTSSGSQGSQLRLSQVSIRLPGAPTQPSLAAWIGGTVKKLRGVLDFQATFIYFDW